ncbi:MAG: DNA repair exonuclease [Geminicoccaceae bacterium]|nr:DNA repair exonuclease [Geminicoccaceae bacterium]
MTVRILHTADWQLGKPFRHIEGDAGPILRDERFKVVERLGALARDEGADAILVAGDIFDGESLPDRHLHRAIQAMRSFPGPWLLLPGNHDPAKPGGIWERLRRLGLPDNVQPLCEPGAVTLLDGRLCVMAAPLVTRHAQDDLSAWMDGQATPGGTARVGLVHGTATGILPGRAADSATNPIARDRARSAGLDYLALGDWHGCLKLDQRTWYSGTPEPDGYIANDSGNALLVEIPSPGAPPAVARHRTAAHHWRSIEHELLPAEDDTGPLRRLEDVLEGLVDPNGTVLRLKLSGRMPAGSHGDLMALEERWRGHLRHLDFDDGGVEVEADLDDLGLLAADPLVAEVADRLAGLAEIGGEESRRARMALRFLHHTLKEAAR